MFRLALLARASRLRRGLLALSVTLLAVPAVADNDCDAPVHLWRSREAVRQLAVQRGWQIQRLKIDDGCYEIRGTDADGRAFKARLDPETLEVVKMKRRERDRTRQQNREPRPSSSASPAAQRASAPLFTPGTAPRGQIE